MNAAACRLVRRYYHVEVLEDRGTPAEVKIDDYVIDYQRGILDEAPIFQLTHLLACGDTTRQKLAPILVIPVSLTGSAGLTDCFEVQASY